MGNIEKILAKIDYLPPFPQTVIKVLQMLRDPGVSPEVIAKVVKFDQSVATNVLHLCNSSYYGLSRPIINLKEAIIYIGFSGLKKIIILSGTRQYFEKRNPGYESKKGELWKHVLATSILAEKLNKLGNYANLDDVFISALLHDIGKLVLSEFVVKASQEISKMVEQEEVTFLEAEKGIIGLDHAEVGARILEMWNFSEEIISAVNNHHMLFDEDNSGLNNIVRISNNLAKIMGYGTSVNLLAYYDLSEICKFSNIEQNTMGNVIADSLEEIKQIEYDFGFPMDA